MTGLMPAAGRDALLTLVRGRLIRPVPDPVRLLAHAVLRRHGRGALAVLAYGSSLRGADPRETLIDLYLLAADERAITRNRLSRLACRRLPPNVYYVEAIHDGVVYRAKYAALSLSAFEAQVQHTAETPYFWARFAQPSALVWGRDNAVKGRIAEAVATAVETMVHEAFELASPRDDALAMWERALAATYATELRSEGPGRPSAIVAADQDWYTAGAGAVLGFGFEIPRQGRRPAHEQALRRKWARRRRNGKALSVLRLVKAAFTFQGGADYLAWKIERHSGVRVELTPWQRRHPLLASLWLFPKLYRMGAFR